MLWAFLQGRLVLGGGVLLVVFGMAAALLGNDMAQRAAADSCDDWPIVDLTMREVIDIKQRGKQYKRDPDPEASMSMFAEEVTFLLRDLLDFQVWLHLDRESFLLHMTWPRADVCYNIDATGTVSALDGVAEVHIDELTVGDLVLTPVLGDRTYVVTPERLEDWGQPAIGRKLRQTTKLWIESSQVHFRLADRSDLY